MTLNEVKNDLFIFFAKKDKFVMDENFDDLYILSEDKDLDAALIEKALEEFVNQKMVSFITTEAGKKVWILEKPLEKYEQTLILSYPTLSAITQIVNAYCEQAKNNQAKVDALNIQEKDIQSLTLLAGQAMGMTI